MLERGYEIVLGGLAALTALLAVWWLVYGRALRHRKNHAGDPKTPSVELISRPEGMGRWAIQTVIKNLSNGPVRVVGFSLPCSGHLSLTQIQPTGQYLSKVEVQSAEDQVTYGFPADPGNMIVYEGIYQQADEGFSCATLTLKIVVRHLGVRERHETLTVVTVLDYSAHASGEEAAKIVR
jgi:hypothetical protein